MYEKYKRFNYRKNIIVYKLMIRLPHYCWTYLKPRKLILKIIFTINYIFSYKLIPKWNLEKKSTYMYGI